MLVIAPATTDLQVAPCEPFLAEAGATHERDRSLVAGLDTHLHPVESKVAERVPEDELQPFAHEPLTGEGLERVVPEVGASEPPVEDLTQPEVADDRAVVVPADEEARIAWATSAHVLAERLRGGRWIRPGAMESPGCTDASEELRFVGELDRADVHAAAAPGVWHLRECRAVTAILALSWPAQ